VSQPIKYIRTNMLDIAYEETGPANGETIVLVHGWPDSVRTWDAVIPALVDAGYRCVAPYLRGFGATRFLDSSRRRSGQATALTQDVKDLVDVLGLHRVVLVGHDWGAFAAYLFAANWPERIQRLVALSVGYGINNPNHLPALPQTQAFWYQWFFQTQQATLALEHDRRGFCQFIWQEWFAPGNFAQQQFDATAPAWDNPDWVAITLHYYRHRWGNVLGDPQYDALEVSRLLPPQIRVPTRLIHGDSDRCILPATTDGKELLFSGGYERLVLPNVGHFPQREAAATVIAAILA
jgi:pimeloyl-ACP methyl ester carboxylesterase